MNCQGSNRSLGLRNKKNEYLSTTKLISSKEIKDQTTIDNTRSALKHVMFQNINTTSNLSSKGDKSSFDQVIHNTKLSILSKKHFAQKQGLKLSKKLSSQTLMSRFSFKVPVHPKIDFKKLDKKVNSIKPELIVNHTKLLCQYGEGLTKSDVMDNDLLSEMRDNVSLHVSNDKIRKFFMKEYFKKKTREEYSSEPIKLPDLKNKINNRKQTLTDIYKGIFSANYRSDTSETDKSTNQYYSKKQVEPLKSINPYNEVHQNELLNLNNDTIKEYELYLKSKPLYFSKVCIVSEKERDIILSMI